MGQSCDVNDNCRGFLWQNGEMTDLNDLLVRDYDDLITTANDIDDFGRITGQAFDADTGQFFAFVAKPSSAESRLSAGVDACSTPADLPVRQASPDGSRRAARSVLARDPNLSRAVGDPEVRSGQRPPGRQPSAVVDGGGRAPRRARRRARSVVGHASGSPSRRAR